MMSMDRGEVDSGRATMTESLGMRSSMRMKQQVEQPLLPGIPNEITLEHITPKLSWTAILILPSVSRGWQQAIQSREVYNGRVRFNSIETVVVVNHKAGPQNFIALYSMRDRGYYLLPSIPDLDGGIPSLCQCVALDGKLYVLGGLKQQYPAICRMVMPASDNVYVLDLAGPRQWKQCASMQEARLDFACGVLDGKIYVFGGSSLERPVRLPEVYDPKVDVWSPIMQTFSLRWDHHVAAVGEELCLYGGGYSRRDQEVEVGRIADALFLEVYHPVRNELRKVDSFGRNGMEKLFVARGKFYSMTRLDISVRDSENGSWTHLHSFSFESLGPVHSVTVEPYGVLAVDNELLAIVHWFRRDSRTSGVCLLQSTGFEGENERIRWEKVYGSLNFGCFPFMYPVQL